MSTATTHPEAAPRVREKDAPRAKERSAKSTTVIPWRRIGLYVVLALGFFLLGAVPMWMRSRENARQRDGAQRQLQSSELQNTLSSAVIDARRGEYELARQTTSDFFTELRKRIDAPPGQKVLSQSQRNNLLPLLKERDDLITLLARSDPAAADRLTNLYVNYRTAMRACNAPLQERTESKRPSEKVGKTMFIQNRRRGLLVDDDESTREMMQLLLKPLGLQIVTPQTSEQARSLIRSNRFDLYILDVWLPQVDGFALCKMIRSSDAEARILFYSGAATKTDIECGLAAGADGYVIKPDITGLISRVERLLLKEDTAVPSAVNSSYLRMAAVTS